MNVNNLDSLFNPKSIAMIGVSKDISKMGGARCLNYLISSGFKGAIYPINPKYDEILGLKCYSDIESIPDSVDVGIVSIPVNGVVDVVRRLAKKVKNIIIFTAGFSETGNSEGAQIEQEIKKIANEYQINICGPNGQGIVNFIQDIPLSFSTALENSIAISGNVGLITQSGAIGTYMLALAREIGVYPGLWVSTGNEVDLDFSDYGSFMIENNEIKVLSGYIEGIRNGEKFKEFVSQAQAKQKPIVLLKVGKTEEGAKAAQSHTASMTGNDEVYDALFKQNKIIRAEGLSELLDYTLAFSKLAPTQGNRVAIVTTSGGIGVLATDYCAEQGLVLAQFSDETKQKMLNLDVPFKTCSNPVDIGLVPGAIGKYLEVLAQDEGVDMILFFSGVAHSMGPTIAEEIIEVRKNCSKPIIVGWVAASQETIAPLVQYDIPVYPDAIRAIKAVGHFVKYYSHHKVEEKHSPVMTFNCTKKERINQARKIFMENGNDSLLSERKSKELLKMYQISTTQGDLAVNSVEAKRIANKIGYPVVIKIESPDISHKTEVNGVVINIKNDAELEIAFNDMIENVKRWDPSARINGILIQEMAANGLEIICGVSDNKTFGKYILLGKGGIEAEVYQDVSRRIAPINQYDVKEMMNELTVSKLFDGYRNLPPYDVDALVDTLLKLSVMIEEIGDYIEEIDLNPIRLYPNGIKVLDARIVLKQGSTQNFVRLKEQNTVN
jgi:acyl-CoA synthetase (NDP forming)